MIYLKMFSSFTHKSQSQDENPVMCELSCRDTCLNDLPEDVFIEVLLRLPVKSLLGIKVVCREWRSHISNPKFVKRHNVRTTANPKNDYLIAYNYIHTTDQEQLRLIKKNPPHRAISLNLPSSITHDNSGVVGSCNGLICLDYRGGKKRLSRKLILWNPATRKAKELPRYNIKINEKNQDDYHFSLGFGFDYASSDYNVVRIVRAEKSSVNLVMVYSLKKNSWKAIEIELEFKGYRYHCRSAFVKGSLYWMIREPCLLSFNLQSENFRTISLSLPDKTSIDKIFEFRESVALCDDYPREVVNIWTLNDGCWIKKLTFNRTLIGRLVGCLMTGEFVGLKSENELVFYDPENEVGKTIQHKKPSRFCSMVTFNYSESLVNLN